MLDFDDHLDNLILLMGVNKFIYKQGFLWGVKAKRVYLNILTKKKLTPYGMTKIQFLMK